MLEYLDNRSFKASLPEEQGLYGTKDHWKTRLLKKHGVLISLDNSLLRYYNKEFCVDVLEVRNIVALYDIGIIPQQGDLFASLSRTREQTLWFVTSSGMNSKGDITSPLILEDYTNTVTEVTGNDGNQTHP